MELDLAAQPDDVDALRWMVRTLAAERTSLAESEAEIERLRLIIRKLQCQQFGRRAEALDNDQLRLGFDDLEADIARVELTLPTGALPKSQSPDRPIAKGRATPALLAHVPVAKYADHLPLYRRSQIFARQSVDLGRPTLGNWVSGGVWWLEPLVICPL